MLEIKKNINIKGLNVKSIIIKILSNNGNYLHLIIKLNINNLAILKYQIYLNIYIHTYLNCNNIPVLIICYQYNPLLNYCHLMLLTDYLSLEYIYIYIFYFCQHLEQMECIIIIIIKKDKMEYSMIWGYCLKIPTLQLINLSLNKFNLFGYNSFFKKRKTNFDQGQNSQFNIPQTIYRDS